MKRFPIITNINDILPFIEGNKNISINQKNDYIVIDYILNSTDLFNDIWTSECRGLVFSADTGEVLSRPFHKFFNLNERPESRSENLDLSLPHVVLEKLDGSMIRPFMSQGKLIWGSKAGETFLSPQVQEFVDNHVEYLKFAIDMIEHGLSPIFEWCSRKNRIVLDYPEDRLVLIAVRNNISGKYSSYSALGRLHNHYMIEVVKAIFNGKSISGNFVETVTAQEFYDVMKLWNGIEGFVVVFDDGHRVKLKCDEYLLCHRAKESINLEKNVVNIIINNQADDFRTLLSEFDRSRFEKFEKDFSNELLYTSEIYYDNIQRYEDWDRKEFAMFSQLWTCKLARNCIFEHWGRSKNIDKSDVYQWIVNTIKMNCGSQINVDKVRNLFGGISWNNY